MEEEYTISIGWKIFMISVAIFLFGFSLFLFSKGEGVNNSPLIYLIPISIVFGSIWIILTQIRGKIIVSDNSIIRINAFSSKEILISDVQGCRVGAKRIIIESVSKNIPSILINNYDLYSNSNDLAKYFRDNFKDLDEVNLENEKAKALQDVKLGVTIEDRQATIKKLKNIAILYNVVGVFFGFISIVISNNIAVVFLLVYPVLGILLMLFSKGLTKFLSKSNRSIYSFTFLGVVFPSFFLLIKSSFEYTLLNFHPLWLPTLMISAVIFICLYLLGINKAIAFVNGQIIIMMITSLLYGFGSIREVNCTFDNSTKKTFKSLVLNRRMESGRNGGYFLTLGQWGPQHRISEENVYRSIYQKAFIGDTVNVNLKQGLLNMPWYIITK